MTRLSDGEIERLLELLDKATPGPWKLGSWEDSIFGNTDSETWLPVTRCKNDDLPIDESPDRDNAACIVALHTAVPALLEELQSLRAANEWRTDAEGAKKDHGYDLVLVGVKCTAGMWKYKAVNAGYIKDRFAEGWTHWKPITPPDEVKNDG